MTYPDYRFDRTPMHGRSRDYGVLSLSEAERGHEIFTVPHALISITDPWEGEARLRPYSTRRHLLRLTFDDVREREEASDTVFDEALARTVADFVVALPSELRLVVHCFAGVSRSAGMVAGIAESFDDHEVVKACNLRYMPNRLVRQLTLSALQDSARRRP